MNPGWNADLDKRIRQEAGCRSSALQRALSSHQEQETNRILAAVDLGCMTIPAVRALIPNLLAISDTIRVDQQINMQLVRIGFLLDL